jgi:hypothetical protein
MTARKQPPTRRQHVELGARLQEAREAVFDAMVLTSRHYRPTAKVTKAAHAALKAMDHLRNMLDDVSAAELPGDLWSPTIYYGANREVRAQWLAANPLDDEPTGNAGGSR